MLVALRGFLDRFGSEEACWQFLAHARWDAGFCCPRCGSSASPSFVRTRRLFQCVACRHQVSVTAGTVLENTKLPLRRWFLGVLLVLSTKKGISGPELSRRLGVSEKTAWFMVQRIASVAEVALPERVPGAVVRDRAVLVNARERARYGGFPPEEMVVALVRVDVGLPGPLRVLRVPSDDPADVEVVTADHVAEGRVTDGSRGPRGRVSAARLALVNAERVMLGVHTRFAPARLQGYLDLFAFRFNSRRDLGAGVLQALGAVPFVRPTTRATLLHPSPG